ncbi:MAG: HRDC domain-containing protein [Actinomycetales bacterium]|nr:HRDC domain-containing protein [Actinomycetales bacterium]
MTPSAHPTGPDDRGRTRAPDESQEALVQESPSRPEPPAPTPLLSPADGIPDVVADERTLVVAAQALADGTGPVAIDAERASGHRYGQHAYLVQLRREGAGTWIVDPVACPDLGPIAEAISGIEWVLHAATQDLPCLREVGLHPTALFDTELGARLAGLPRVGLGASVEHYLGLSLAKEHSAVDWSKRPLPEPWLRYAALDVEVLVELRDRLAADLQAQGKDDWARQEFAALVDFAGPPVRVDPWRRTSGMHKVRRRRTVAVVRELWLARDRIAQRRDISPGRVLPDAALMALALDPPKDAAAIGASSHARSAARHSKAWVEAIQKAMALPDTALPPLTLPSTGPPPPRLWSDRDPVAARRLADARAMLGDFAVTRQLPLENLLSPDTLRRALWTPPLELTETAFAEALTTLGARRWQVEIVAPVLATVCRDGA